MKCVFDLEGNNLMPDIDTIWCGVFTDIETNKKYKFKPDELSEMMEFMDKCDTLIGHNGLGFDFPALEHVLNYEYKGNVVDTLVLSTLTNPDRYGGHSVENWAKLLKLDQQKVEHEDWSKYTPEMLHRCSTDVDIQVEIYKAVIKELSPHPETYINWDSSIILEHAIRRIITRQELNGVPFNTNVARGYLKTLEGLIQEISEDVNSTLGKRTKKDPSPIKTIFKIDGAYRQHILDRWGSALESDRLTISGEFCKVGFEQIRLSMYAEVKNKLISFGWVPSAYTDKGSPKMPSVEELEEVARMSDNPSLNVIAKYGSYANRRGIISKWIETAEKRGDMLPAGAFTNGTNTARFKHTVVVNVPKASKDKETKELLWYPNDQPVFFGTEMRSLFYSGNDPDYVMVGADAAGLELRCLAHYLNNDHFNETLLDGDVHKLFWEAAGGASWINTRDDMKNVTYGWLYGAGDMKIASMCTAKVGKHNISWGRTVRRNLLKGVAGLADLVDAVVNAANRGYLAGLDGRKIWMRKSNGRVQTHKALNTLLQSTGSILIKHWTVLVNDTVDKLKLRARQVIHMHDEMQWICHKDDVEQLSSVLKQCMIDTGKHFNFNIPLEADVSIGMNWAETH